MSTYRNCTECNKDLHSGFFNDPNIDLCVFCNQDEIPKFTKEAKEYEEVEDKGCAGGACTL